MPHWLYLSAALSIAWLIAGIFYTWMLVAWAIALALVLALGYGARWWMHTWVARNQARRAREEQEP